MLPASMPAVARSKGGADADGGGEEAGTRRRLRLDRR